MRRVSSKKIVAAPITIILAIVLMLVMLPVSVHGNLPPTCRYSGLVTLNGENVDNTAEVRAWIDGSSDGPYVVNTKLNNQNISSYSGLDVYGKPENNNAKVHFVVFYKGKSYNGTDSTFLYMGSKSNNLYLSEPVIGAIEILKQDQNQLPLGGSSFTITPGPDGNPSMTVVDNGANDEDISEGVLFVSNVAANVNYVIHESVVPVGFEAAPDQTVTVNTNTTAIVTFTNNAIAPVITTNSLPDATVGQLYIFPLTIAGGLPPYNWEGNGLPNGLAVDNGTGNISGIPTPLLAEYSNFSLASPRVVNYDLSFQVTDSLSQTGTKNISLKLKWIVGDANGDGEVTMADVNYVEQVILLKQPSTPGCDADLSNSVNMLDIAWIELIIMAQP
jgi:hypothetical protein